MRYCLCMLLMVLGLTAQAQMVYAPLEPESSLMFLGNRIVYKGDTITLDNHNIFLDGSLSDAEADAHPHVYNSFKEAAEAFVNGTEEKPMRVFIAPYVYWVDNPDDPKVAVGKNGREPFGMVVRCENLHFIGLSDDACNVVLASQRGQTQGAVGNFTMFLFIGNGLQVSNLTMGNYCNVDLEFPLKPELSRKKRSSAITQAHVAYCHGDRAVARNVRFISRLNMNPLNGARRILFDRCHMECTDDALTGNGVYLHCTIGLYGQKPFYTTHRCGAVFLDCDFFVESNNREMVFCKAPGVLSLIDCRYHSSSDSTYVGWTNYPEPWMRCYQGGFSLNGKPYRVGDKMAENTVEIDRLELLKAYKGVSAEGKTEYNLYNLLRGDDGWNPTAMSVDYADMPTCLLANKRKVQLQTGRDSIVLSATLMRHSGYDMSGFAHVDWSVQAGYAHYVRLVPLGGDSILVVPTNNTDETARFSILAHTSYGHQTAVAMTVEPRLQQPPKVTKIAIEQRGDSLYLNYNLNLQGRRDESEIIWYRSKDKEGRGAVAVSVSHRSPKRSYALSEADKWYYIGASIRPKSHLSNYGEKQYVSLKKVVNPKKISKLQSLTTDLADFPCQWQPLLIPGCWTVDGFKPQDTAEYPWDFDKNKPMWAYAKGFNGAVGWGLVQAQRGARMMYTPLDGSYRDMSLTLNVDPTKTAGQGFGSATGQYMDICIKFDTRTLTGYALRIIRTTKHAKAVDFYLVEYKNGLTKAISSPISSGCYRTGCTISLSVKDNLLTAHVETSTPLPADSPLPVKVDLSATITPNTFGGVAIQHTGSCGESTTMLHNLSVEWK